ALRNVAGVSTFGAGEGGGGNVTTNDKITIRGFSANGNIYIDGIRDIAGYSRDMFNFEQVEVTKGASSSITGKGSSGGSINLVSKRAEQDEFSTVEASFDEAERLRTTIDHNTQLNEKVALRINGLYTQGGDAFNNGVEEYQTTAIAPSLRVDFNDKTALTADLLHMKQDNNPMLGLPWVNADVAAQLNYKEGPLPTQFWNNYYGVAKRDFEDVSVNLATLLIEHQFADNVLLRSQTRVASNEKQSVLARPMFDYTTDAETKKRIYKNQINISPLQIVDQENDLAATQFDAIINLSAGAIKHDLVVGAEYYQEETTRYTLSNNIKLNSNFVSIDKPNTNTPFSGEISRSGEPTVVKGTGLALYALDSITLNDQWLATVGLRFEDYQAEGSSYVRQVIDNKRVSVFVDDLSADGTFLSWNGSLAYKPNAHTNYYFGIANSQDPAGGDLAFSGSSLEGITRVSSLDPQEAKTYELGAKWDLLAEKLQISTALFLTNKTVLDTDLNGTYFLAGEQQAKGFEFSANGSITEQLSVLASYTHQKTEVTQDYTPDTQGNGLSAAPKNSANLWLSYEQDKLSLGAGAQYSSGNVYWRRNMAFFDSGSQTLLNVMAGYDVTDKLALQLNIDNLTDEEYVTDYSARGHFRPGNPRTMKLTVRYQF
ncbi:TonB-dependent receptor, partial [Pseudoalteromonas tunicata]|uniref:TonB-dependent receptor n=1 Tax=Pseudoalteromonas tunicata TaxID=314281 RepID=UPI00273F3DD1